MDKLFKLIHYHKKIKPEPEPEPEPTEEEDTKWECPVCLDNINFPLITNCGHSICMQCIQKLIKQECPKCREKIKTIAANYALGNILDLECSHEKLTEIQESIEKNFALPILQVPVLSLPVPHPPVPRPPTQHSPAPQPQLLQLPIPHPPVPLVSRPTRPPPLPPVQSFQRQRKTEKKDEASNNVGKLFAAIFLIGVGMIILEKILK